MNDQIQTSIRKLLTLAAGFLIAKGLLKENQIDAQLIDFLAATMITVGTYIWSMLHQKKLLNSQPPPTITTTLNETKTGPGTPVP